MQSVDNRTTRRDLTNSMENQCPVREKKEKQKTEALNGRTFPTLSEQTDKRFSGEQAKLPILLTSDNLSLKRKWERGSLIYRWSLEPRHHLSPQHSFSSHYNLSPFPLLSPRCKTHKEITSYLKTKRKVLIRMNTNDFHIQLSPISHSTTRS